MAPPLPLDRYSLRQRPVPRSRRARCEEVECPAHVYGWVTRLAVTDTGRLAQVAASGRHYTEQLEGDFVAFTFPAGQQCFGEHWTDRMKLYIARGTSTRPELWVEQFGENQERLAEIQARG